MVGEPFARPGHSNRGSETAKAAFNRSSVMRRGVRREPTPAPPSGFADINSGPAFRRMDFKFRDRTDAVHLGGGSNTPVWRRNVGSEETEAASGLASSSLNGIRGQGAQAPLRGTEGAYLSPASPFL